MIGQELWAKDKNNYSLFSGSSEVKDKENCLIVSGINLLMYALTGNYKSDQVHSKSILERLKRR